MIAESETQHNIVVWGLPLGKFNIMACGPHCLTTKPGSAFNFCSGICRQQYVFVEMLTFVFEAIACGTWVAASVLEGATFVEVLSHPSKDISEPD